MHKILTKMRDPGMLTVPCEFGNSSKTNALADSRAINLMSYSFYKKLDLLELKTIRKFVFPIDFVVLDMEEDDDIPMISVRPFLSTVRTLVDIHDSKLTLRVGSDE